MRGEELNAADYEEPVTGSPPHARGRGNFTSSEVRDERITPACAGKSKFVVLAVFGDEDHPRMRGEELL